MIVNMKHRLLAFYITAATLLAPVVAFAAKEDEETAKLEARLEGFPVTVHTPGGSTSLTWIMIGFLAALTIACLFKNAKRTHLD